MASCSSWCHHRVDLNPGLVGHKPSGLTPKPQLLFFRGIMVIINHFRHELHLMCNLFPVHVKNICQENLNSIQHVKGNPSSRQLPNFTLAIIILYTTAANLSATTSQVIKEILLQAIGNRK